MTIQFLCPTCDRRVKAKEEHTGRTAPCPHCKNPATIPPPASEWLKELKLKKNDVADTDSFILKMAMASGRVDVMDLLASKGILRIDMKGLSSGQISGCTLMHDGALGGYLGAMKWLKEKGLGVDDEVDKGFDMVDGVVDKYGDRPIHFAASCGHVNVAEWLLGPKNNIDVNAKGQGGRTPMHQAAAAGRVDMIRCLKKHGANIELRCSENASPLDEWHFHLSCKDLGCVYFLSSKSC